MDKEVKRKLIIISVIVIIFVIIDQSTKTFTTKFFNEGTQIIPGVISYSYVENTGGSFGVAQNNILSFVVTNIVVLGIIIKFLITQVKMMDLKTISALILILSGGLGNLIDRIFRGYVVDFIKIELFTFPNFNLADVCIIVGYILLALSFAIYAGKELKEKKKEK